jgi:hypothetical protein
MVLLRRAAMARRGGVGLVGAMARTAVVAGTATAVSHRVSRRNQRRDEEAAASEQLAMQEQIQASQAQQAQMAVANATTAPTTNVTAELQQLFELKSQGALTEAEFQAAKQKLIGNG